MKCWQTVLMQYMVSKEKMEEIFVAFDELSWIFFASLPNAIGTQWWQMLGRGLVLQTNRSWAISF